MKRREHRIMFAIYKRELRAYIFSPIAYVLMGLFICILSIFFSSAYNTEQPNFGVNLVTWVLSIACQLLVFLLPIMTMRSFAEERKNATDVLLISSPSVFPKLFCKIFISNDCLFCVDGINCNISIIMLIKILSS